MHKVFIVSYLLRYSVNKTNLDLSTIPLFVIIKLCICMNIINYNKLKINRPCSPTNSTLNIEISIQIATTVDNNL